jgi:uncharacterized protein YdeI (YjbR/CyaY-like superfamily)
MCPLESPTT